MIRRLAVWFGVALVASATLRAQEPPKKDATAKKSDAKWWVSPEKHKDLEDRYAKLRERLALLERQQKGERLAPSVCKVTARLEGDVVVGQAEYRFATPLPGMTVFLGLKGGFLADEGSIDDAVPHLESGDDGFAVRVEKEGTHRLTLGFRAATASRRGGAPNERGFDLGLPGAAVTTLTLAWPNAVKEIRWNDLPAAPKSPGQWDVTIGAQKQLAVTWKEVGASATTTASAKANVRAKLDETRIELAGELTLEDAKASQREWQVWLPFPAKATPAPGSAPFAVVSPENKGQPHLLRLTEPADKISVAFQALVPRTQQKIPLGPFLAQGATMQGSILILAAPGTLRGQRLVYHRYGETYQRDPPKATTGSDPVALFQFWNASANGKGLSPGKASLELEWKTEKGQVDATTEHDVRFRDEPTGAFVEVESRFAVRSPNSGLDALDVQVTTGLLPTLSHAVAPAPPWPLNLRWALSERGDGATTASAEDDGGDLDAPALDAQGRLRLKLNRPIGKGTTVTVRTRTPLGPGATRAAIELPRLVGVTERGAKVTTWPPPGHELLVSEQPAPDKAERSFERAPPFVDAAWRPSRRDRVVDATADVTLAAREARVRMQWTLPAEAATRGGVRTGQLAIRVPPGARMPPAWGPVSDKNLVWAPLPPETKGKYVLTFAYEVDLPGADAQRPGGVPFPEPEGGFRVDLTARVWTESSAAVRLASSPIDWRERPIADVPGRDWPALVVVASGSQLELRLVADDAPERKLPPIVAERTLVQVRIDDEGNQDVRVRMLAQRLAGAFVDVDLPTAFDATAATFKIAGRRIDGVKPVSADKRRVRVPLAPELYPRPTTFEMQVRTPAAEVEGRRFWRTPFAMPRVMGDAVHGATRWQTSTPDAWATLVLGPGPFEYRWGVDGYLLATRPSTTAAELEVWIGGGDATPAGAGLAWWGSVGGTEAILHLPKRIALLLGSALLLALGLTALLAPMPRWLLGTLGVALALGLTAAGLVHGFMLPALFAAIQPAIPVLLLAAAVQWALDERHRRQLLFLPTFSRVPPGSTVARTASRARERSTIDRPESAEPSAGPASSRGP